MRTRHRERVQAHRNQCAFNHSVEVRRPVFDLRRRSQDCVSTYTIHLVYLPVRSRLCDKTNVRLMRRYDRSMAHISSEFTSFTPIYVETVAEPEPSSARNVGGTGAAYGPHAAALL